MTQQAYLKFYFTLCIKERKQELYILCIVHLYKQNTKICRITVQKTLPSDTPEYIYVCFMFEHTIYYNISCSHTFLVSLLHFCIYLTLLYIIAAFMPSHITTLLHGLFQAFFAFCMFSCFQTLQEQSGSFSSDMYYKSRLQAFFSIMFSKGVCFFLCRPI